MKAGPSSGIVSGGRVNVTIAGAGGVSIDQETKSQVSGSITGQSASGSQSLPSGEILTGETDKSEQEKAEEAKDEEAKAEEAKDEEAKAEEAKAEEAKDEEAKDEGGKDEEGGKEVDKKGDNDLDDAGRNTGGTGTGNGINPSETQKTEKQLFRIHQYDPISGAVRRKRIVELEIADLSQDKTLGKIRELLIAKKVFDKLHKNSSFCDTDGTVVSDDMALSVYEDQVKTSIEENKGENNDQDNNKKQVSDLSSKSLVVLIFILFPKAPTSGTDKQATKGKDLYYRKRRKLGDLNQTAKDFLNKGVDLKLKDPAAFLKADTTLLKSSYDASLYRASEGAALAHPADLTEHQWSIIVRTNCILSGYAMVEYEKPGTDGKMTTGMKVQRSPYNAFTLKSRNEDYEIAAPSKVEGENEGTEVSNGSAENTYRIPRFWVDDDSYVTVMETKNTLQQSMAKNSFSETSVQASVGAGFWGGSGAVSGGWATNKSTQTVDGSANETHQLTITYNFPRVSVLLDSKSLEISKECQDDLKQLSDKESYIKFGKDYGKGTMNIYYIGEILTISTGHVFAQRVELGGQLSSSESFKADSGNKITDQSNAMRAKAAASFSSPYLQVSGSFDHQEAGGANSNASHQNLNNSMVWEAKGGNTLLCNNPPSWCATVGDFYNWRVVQQHDVVPLYKVLAQLSDDKNLARRFELAFKGDSKTIRFRLIEQETKQPLKLFEEDPTLYKELSRHQHAKAMKGHQGERWDPGFYMEVCNLALETNASIRVTSDGDGIDTWETQILKDPSSGDKIYLGKSLSIQSSGDTRYLGFSHSLLDKDCEGDQLPYYLALQDRRVQFVFQTCGRPKKKGPIGPNTEFEIVVVDPNTNTNLGLLTETKSNNGLVGIEPWEPIHKNKSLAFKMEVVGVVDQSTN
ncbi:hypothetical protein BDV38DRAFT_287447 [Aspergillus pseudotamarii]|uniref:MACPF-like domain-containing protein n=1 Tax=Aspergillus pseudotamarii TaxID=132259 RepID=A0A5N6SG75_ASPPS|nr:uncharacterized protein BDV38DRAFT_287447 [Aspergillus pseudotamarii]KAE8132730.1 hypothetical protein BDV38DRAFT_287447 [Aspergillus pseudotamarii]